MKKLITILAFLLIVSPAWGANTLFEYYDGNLPSIAERAVEYKNIANDVYRGGFEQNIALLEYLESGKLGGNVPSSAINWTLAIPHSSSATTIDVSDFEDLRGNDIATTSMPTKIYFVIEPENPSNAEIVMCLAANGNETNTRFTSCTRGLAFSGTAETAVTANQKSHPSGANVIMTNVGQFFNNFVDITDDQTIAGVKTFSSIPLLPANNPTANNEAVRKAYADNIANQGAATSTEAKGGISELATQAEMSAGTDGGTEKPLVLQSKYATSTGDIATTSIVITEADGNINQQFLDLTEDFAFSGDTHLASSTMTATATHVLPPVMRATTTLYKDQQLVYKGYVDNEDMYIFTPAGASDDTHAQVNFSGDHYGLMLDYVNNQNGYTYWTIKIPDNLSTISSVKVAYRATARGNLVLEFDTGFVNFSASSTYASDTTDAASVYTSGTSNNVLTYITVPTAAYDGLTITPKGYFSIDVGREASGGSDTYEATWDVVGILMEFE